MSDSSLTQAEQQKLAIITSAINKQITNGQAAKQLGLSVRQVQRLKVEVRRNGTQAVIHKLKGKLGNHHIDPQVKNKVLQEIKEKYVDFKPKFATEKIQKTYQVAITSQTVRVWMSEEGLWKAKKTKEARISCLEAKERVFWRVGTV